MEKVRYKGIVKERTPERKIFLLIVSAIVLYLSYKQGNYLYMALALVMMSAIFYRKEHIVDETGTYIIYIFFEVFKVKYKWGWDEITAVAPDYEKVSPDVLVEINKDITIRGFVFSKEDAKGVLELAKRMNPSMYVDDRNEQERREAKAAREARIEEAKRARKQQRKKK